MKIRVYREEYWPFYDFEEIEGEDLHHTETGRIVEVNEETYKYFKKILREFIDYQEKIGSLLLYGNEKITHSGVDFGDLSKSVTVFISKEKK